MRGRKNGYTYNTKKHCMCLHNSLFPDLKNLPILLLLLIPLPNIRLCALRPTADFPLPRIALAIL